MIWAWVVPLLLFLCGFSSKTDAQLTILHNFGDGSVPNDGWSPQAGVIQGSDGNFYGTTYLNPSEANGTVFQMTPSGTVTILYTFTSNTYGPTCELFDYNGTLIGTTELGGVSGGKAGSYGTVFATPISGTTEFWHEFHDGSVPHDGWAPFGGVILGSDGFLYGTTIKGGTHGEGTIYKIDPTTQKLSIVYSFGASANEPWAALLLASDGNYYGTTSVGTENDGAIFKMTPEGKVSVVYEFPASGATGVNVRQPLIQASDGNFYGVATAGGKNVGGGTVFKMTPGFVVTVLHNFGERKDGSSPFGALVQGPDGALYGTTASGGTTKRHTSVNRLGVDAGSLGYGIVFRITTDGTYTVLHNFGDGSVPNDGEFPDGSLTVGSDGNLYGTTTQGGTAGHGTVYKISP
jgi:uncharacterized repeat protein (TIGR03803 family)